MHNSIANYPVPLKPHLPRNAYLVGGVPMLTDRAGQQYFNPATVCLYALAYWNQYLATGDAAAERVFLTQARWLVERAEIRQGKACWLHTREFPRYRTGSNWVSGMSQGLAISVLCRAYAITNDDTYHELADFALEVMKLKVGEGGVRAHLANGYVAFEEFPSPLPSLVLNGNMYAIIGIYDHLQMVESDGSRVLLEQALVTLDRLLPHYDYHGWSLYDLLKRWNTINIASAFYHGLHVMQLRAIVDLARHLGVRLTNVPRYLGLWAVAPKGVKWRAASVRRALQVSRGLRGLLKRDCIWSSLLPDEILEERR